jgi:uncharacterized protein YegP (UPF0339 family)
MKSFIRSLSIAIAVSSTVLAVGCSSDVGNDTGNQTETQRSGSFEVFEGQDGQHYFRLRAGNGEIVLASEGYVSKQGAVNGVEAVKTYAVVLDNYEQRESQDGQFYFVLKADNHEIIGTSETYVSKSNAARGAGTVREIVAKILRIEAATTGGAHFDIFVGADEQIYFHLQAANGEIVLQSEGYVSEQGARKGVASVRTHGKSASNFEVSESADEQFYFVLKAANGETIGVSETYVSKSNAERGVGDVVALLVSERVADAADLIASEDEATADVPDQTGAESN